MCVLIRLMNNLCFAFNLFIFMCDPNYVLIRKALTDCQKTPSIWNTNEHILGTLNGRF